MLFEYASNGTLYDNLHCCEEGCKFSRTRHMKIVIGIGRGLGSSFQGNYLKSKDLKQHPSIQCAGASPCQEPPVANSNLQPAEYVSKHHGTSKPLWLLTLEIVSGAMVGSLFLVAVLTACQNYPEMLKDVRIHSRQELEVACEDFNNIIGSLQNIVVYKGNMKGGPEIAVIFVSIKEEHWEGYLELYFQREVADLAM